MDDELPQPQSDYSRAHALLLANYLDVVRENVGHKKELRRLKQLLKRIAVSAGGGKKRKRKKRKPV